MSIFGLAKKHFLLLLVVSAIYFAYVSIVLKPWSFKNFSLIDDGQVYMQSTSYFEDCISRLHCSKFLDQTLEYGTNRFRPSYWITQNILYEGFRDNAQAHHIFRVYVVGYIAILLMSLILLDMKVGPLFILTAVALFTSNYSFTENFLRIGPNEPYQVVFLALFSIIYLKKDEVRNRPKVFFPFMVALLVWTILLKENNAAVLLAILLSALAYSGFKNFKKTLILVAVPAAILALGIFLTKFVPTTISSEIPVYTSNYSSVPKTILNNIQILIGSLFNSMSPFLKLAFVSFPFLFTLRKFQGYLKEKKFYYWIFFSFFFTAIMFPWKFILERYQLVAIFGLVIVVAFLFDKALLLLEGALFHKAKQLLIYRIMFNVFIFLVVINLFFRGFPLNLAKSINYREWYLTFTTFELEQVRAIAKYNDKGIYINAVNNINNWEVLYEIPIHLKYLYGLYPNTGILGTIGNQKTYVFSRLPFDLTVQTDDLEKAGYKIVDAKSYHVDQIDPIKFRQKFVNQPLRTIINPPLSERGFDYYWEIRSLEK